MAETPSSMLQLGTIAPPFKLLEVCSNKLISLEEISFQHAIVIMFICNHCPYVLHILKKLVAVTHEYQKKGIKFIAINSNNIIKYPADSPENMKKLALRYGFNFPYVFDETQTVAKAYHAECTPDFFMFDHALKCVYRGRFDEATPGNGAQVTGKELLGALDAVIDGREVDSVQRPSLGCNIKWV